MKLTFKNTTYLLFLLVLIFPSCVNQKRIACPTFNSGKVNKLKINKIRIEPFDTKISFSLKKKQKTIRLKSTQTKHANNQINKSFIPNEIENPLGLKTFRFVHNFIQNNDIGFDNMEIKTLKTQKQHRKLNANIKKMNTSIQTSKKNSFNFIEKKETNNIAPKRKTAKVIGGSLLLMAVLAGIAMPALGTLTASLGLIGIFILDILVSFGIYNYHKNEKTKLARVTSIMRLIYTAIFGIGIGYHIMGNVPLFNQIWGIGLITFGIHLITLGILYNNEGGKKWINIIIKSLLIIAGIGYLIQYVGILFVANPLGYAKLIQSIFIIPMILGEITYAVWMLIKGGKVRKTEIKRT